MEKTIKEKTIDSLLADRSTLVKALSQWQCSYNQHVCLPSQIKNIDDLIMKLNTEEGVAIDKTKVNETTKA